MNDFNDVNDTSISYEESSDNMEWEEFDAEMTETTDVLEDEDYFQDVSVTVAETEECTSAEQAADYARSFGFEKAADYIERHYDGEEFIPGNPIRITTRNMALDGEAAENGVFFERKITELTDGLSVDGVFPKFDSKYHVELGEKANDMSLYKQFSECRENFQDHMYDSSEILNGITFGDMERMDHPQGYTPEGYTWQHNPETGSFDLVLKTDHSVGHTGGNALWGI